MQLPPFLRRHWVTLTLLLILVVAAGLRLNGRTWDDGTMWHPDERHVVFDGTMAHTNLPPGTTLAQLLDARHSPLNPRTDAGTGQPVGWVYGTLPVYIVKLTAWGASQVVDLIDSVGGAYIPGSKAIDPAKQITIPGGQLIPQWDGKVPAPSYYFDAAGVTQTGRTMANLFDVFTVFLVFLIGRRLYGPRAGLLAAAFSALAVTQIQISNFYIVEPYLVTFMTAVLYFSVVLMQKPGIWPALGAGLCLGFALACKVSVAPLALVIIAALVLRAVYRQHTRRLGPDPNVADPTDLRPSTRAEREQTFGQAAWRLFPLLVLAGVATIVAFFIGDPYAFLHWDHSPNFFDFSAFQNGGGLRAYLDSLGNQYLHQLLIEADNQSGVNDVPFTRQFIGTIPGVYHFQQVIQWGMGPASGLVALAALFWGLWRVLRGRAQEILLLSGMIAYFLTIFRLEAKWPRYMLPIVPYLCLLAAGLLVAGLAWSSRAGWVQQANEWVRAASIRGLAYRETWGTQVRRWIFPAITAMALLGSLVWAFAFDNIYNQPFSAVQSAQWLVQNAPNGASLGQEGWDETEPVGLVNGQVPADAQKNFVGVSFNIYDDRPGPTEFDYFKGLFQQTDYIVLNSNRLYRTIPKLPWRYPVAAKYYELLFAGKLGYQMVYTGHVMPSIFGINIDDQAADESYTVYDHPQTFIFQKVRDVSEDELRTLFGNTINQPSIPVRHAANPQDKSLLLDQPVGQQPALGDYAWNPLAQNQWIALLLWLLVVEVLGLLAWPLIALICRRLPDRGYPLAKITGLLIVAWITWMLSSLRWAPFTVWSIGAAMIVLGLLGLWAWRRQAGELGSFLRGRVWLVVGWEALFLVAFGFFVFVRMLDPDLWQPWLGGEKPMEFAFLNGILRSAWMPPIDSFFANGYINYYYYGHYIVAVLIKFVGLDPAVGFNIAIPTLYGFVALGAASVVYNCVALVQRARGWLAPASRTAFGFGLIGSFLLVGIGNLQGGLQMLYLTPVLRQPASAILSTLAGWGLADRAIVSQVSGMTSFDFWSASRVIQDGSINEFPYWTFLFADLHPHLIGLAFTILVAALALALLLGIWRWPALQPVDQATLDVEAPLALPAGGPWYRVVGRALLGVWGAGPADAALRFGVTALALGSLAAINTWDFPTYAALIGVSLLLAVVLVWAVTGEHRLSTRTALILAAVGSAIIVTGAALLFYWPFFANFKTLAVGGLKPITPGAPDTPWERRTYLGEFLTVWGLFIFIALSYLILRLRLFPWRAAVADWTGWFGWLRGPSAAERPAPVREEPTPQPRPAPPVVGLADEGAYSAELPASNGHAVAEMPADGATAPADDGALPVAEPIPALGFLSGVGPLDTSPHDPELAPGLHPATAEHDAAPANGHETADEPDDYVLADAGALGQVMDDEEVRRHGAPRLRAASAATLDEDDALSSGDNGYSDAADDYTEEPAPPLPRRTIPLERPPRDPTYSMRVNNGADNGSDEDAADSGEAAASPAEVQATSDDTSNEGAASVSSVEVAEPAFPPTVTAGELTPVDDGWVAPAMTAPEPAFPPPAAIGELTPVDDGWVAPAATAPEELPAVASSTYEDLVTDYAGLGAAPTQPSSPAPPDETLATDYTRLDVEPGAPDLTVHTEAAPVDAPPPELETSALPAPAMVVDSTIEELPDDEAAAALDAETPEPPPPARPVAPQRGLFPAGLGLLGLGLTGVVTLVLAAEREWVLALLALLIGGLLTTHLTSVRARGVLFGGMLIITALAVAMFVELFYLSDFLGGGPSYRMNTVFKFYMQVWVLFAMGSAVALYLLIGPRGRGPALATATAGPDEGPLPGDALAGTYTLQPGATTMPLTTGTLDEAPPATASAAEPVAEDADPLGWLTPPAALVPPAEAALAADEPTPPAFLVDETAPAMPAPDIVLDEIAVSPVETVPSDFSAAETEPEPPAASMAGEDASAEIVPSDLTAAEQAPEPPAASMARDDTPAADAGAATNAVSANLVAVDGPAPESAEPAEPAGPGDSRPGLGPGTYDADSADPPGGSPAPAGDSGAADEPAPAAPVWSDAAGAAWADAAAEQATVAHEPGETQIVEHTPALPLDQDTPEPPVQPPDAEAALLTETAEASMLPRVVRPPVRRPPVRPPVRRAEDRPVIAADDSPVAAPAEPVMAAPVEAPVAPAPEVVEPPVMAPAAEIPVDGAADAPEAQAVAGAELAVDAPAVEAAVGDEFWPVAVALAVDGTEAPGGLRVLADDELPLASAAAEGLEAADELPVAAANGLEAAAELPVAAGVEGLDAADEWSAAPDSEEIAEPAAPVSAAPAPGDGLVLRTIPPVPPEEFPGGAVERAPGPAWLQAVGGAGRAVWYLLFLLLLLGAFAFTVAGTKARVENRFPPPSSIPPIGTLNGMDWMDDAQPQICLGTPEKCATIYFRFEREVLEWMRKNIDGAPVVADDPREYYRGKGCIVGTYTGLPILLCTQHEGEQRYSEQVGERQGDTEELFRTTDPERARIIIAKYDVQYVYIGQIARLAAQTYNNYPEPLTKFDDMVRDGLLEVVKKNEGVTLYHVKAAAIQPATNIQPGVPRPSPTPKPTPTEPPLGTDPQLVQLEAAVQANPLDIAARATLGNYYRDHKNFSKAVVQFQEILKLSPKDVATYQILGDTYQEMGNPDEALKSWEEAATQVPDNPDAHNKLGIAYRERGRFDEAVREFQKTVELNPKFVEASFHLGEVYETLQQKDNAIKAYQAVIANGGDTDWVKNAQTKLNALK